MRLKCVDTGKTTKLSLGGDCFEGELITDAMTRLVRREPEYSSGCYFASPIRIISFVSDFYEYAACRRAEICRPITGGHTEHTDKYLQFEFVD